MIPLPLCIRAGCNNPAVDSGGICPGHAFLLRNPDPDSYLRSLTRADNAHAKNNKILLRRIAANPQQVAQAMSDSVMQSATKSRGVVAGHLATGGTGGDDSLGVVVVERSESEREPPDNSVNAEVSSELPSNRKGPAEAVGGEHGGVDNDDDNDDEDSDENRKKRSSENIHAGAKKISPRGRKRKRGRPKTIRRTLAERCDVEPSLVHLPPPRTSPPPPPSKVCSRKGCPNEAKEGHHLCVAHGDRYVYRCRHEGCNKHVVNSGLCWKHGACHRAIKRKRKPHPPPSTADDPIDPNKVVCSLKRCSNEAKEGHHLCVKHRCRHEGCSNHLVNSGLCWKHGARRGGVAKTERIKGGETVCPEHRKAESRTTTHPNEVCGEDDSNGDDVNQGGGGGSDDGTTTGDAGPDRDPSPVSIPGEVREEREGQAPGTQFQYYCAYPPWYPPRAGGVHPYTQYHPGGGGGDDDDDDPPHRPGEYPPLHGLHPHHRQHPPISFFQSSRWDKDDDAALVKVMAKLINPKMDWGLVAKELNWSKSPRDCKKRWTGHLRSKVLKEPWTDEEDEIIVAAVQKSMRAPFRTLRRWQDLADQKLPGRTGKQIRDRWVNHLNPALHQLPFTRDDDLLLWYSRFVLGKRWAEISSEHFKGTRSENRIKCRWNSPPFRKFVAEEFGPDVYEHANKVSGGGSLGGSGGKAVVLAKELNRNKPWAGYLSPEVRKGQWTDEEDKIIVDAVQNSMGGPLRTHRRWQDLAQKLPGRVGKQIQLRWMNHLNPALHHLPFSREDDLLLWECRLSGKRWAEISSEHFKGTRSQKGVMSRWRSPPFKKFVAKEFGPDAYERANGGAGGGSHGGSGGKAVPPAGTASRMTRHLPFSREDDLLLWECHRDLGKRWVEISSKHFKGTRSPDSVKCRWRSPPFKKFVAKEFGPDAYERANKGGGGRSHGGLVGKAVPPAGRASQMSHHLPFTREDDLLLWECHHDLGKRWVNAALSKISSGPGGIVPTPGPIPDPQPQAMHNEPYTVVGRVAVGQAISISTGPVSKKVRKKDKKRRKGRVCKLCRDNGGRHLNDCSGRTGRGTCHFFQDNGVEIKCETCLEFDGGGNRTCAAWSNTRKSRVCEYFEKDGTPK